MNDASSITNTAIESHAMVDRIRILTGNNANTRRYCVTELLRTASPSGVYDKLMHCTVPEEVDQCIDSHVYTCAPTSHTINAILKVPGVTGLKKFDYELSVTKAAAFDWPECHEKILDAIKTHLFAGKKVMTDDRIGEKSPPK
ncbi:MAG: hypothetical protein P4L53_03855 [Candidatus Obscuribacterales bacterium]|nr:hypothetical protein [Candidatus Obscuribacterales bacterium]